MKKLFYFLTALIFIFGCSKTDISQTPSNRDGNSFIEFRNNSTVYDVLNNGVLSPSDFDLLINEGIFPFNKLSSTSSNDFKNTMVFVNGKLRSIGSNLFYYDLTYDEALLFLQIVSHTNPRLEDTHLVTFKENGINSYKYVNDSNLGTSVFVIGLHLCDDDEDCCDGGGTCADLPL